MTRPRNPYPTVDVVVEVEGGLVLIERAHAPRGWALPGGFIDYGESPEDAARREVMEETGLEVTLTALLGVYGAPGRDPRQHNLSVVYIGHAAGAPRAGDDAASASVHPVDALPSPLCFDHAAILDDYRALLKTGRAPTPTPPRGPIVLAAARDAIRAAVTGTPPEPGADERRAFARVPGAAFVTLRRRDDGALRGCIGELVAERPLMESVRECAAGAALRDPRFPPVTVEELPGLRIGVSLLSPPHRLADPEALEVGRHGILLERGARRGVLLPEVATDAGWDRRALLEGVCRKAGLDADAWADPATRLSVFETEKLVEP